VRYLVLALMLVFACSFAYAQDAPAPTDNPAEGAKEGEKPAEKPADKEKPKPEEKADALDWMSDMDAALKKAKEEKRFIFVIFTNPDNCPPCRMLDSQTLPDPKVQEFLKSFVLAKFDAWDKGKGAELANKYAGTLSIPSMVVLDPEGNLLGKMTGYKPVDEFIKAISGIRDSKKNMEEGKKLIEADATNPEGYLKLAGGQATCGQADEAMKNLEKVVELDPKNEKEFAGKAYEKMAELHAEGQRFDKAVEIAKKLGELDPENKKGLGLKSAEMLSGLYGRLRNIEKSLEYAVKVVELDADNKAGKGLETAFNLGNYYARGKGDIENAKKYFDMVRKMDPEDKEDKSDTMDLVLAGIPAAKGEFEEAAKNVEKFIEEHKDSKLLPAANMALAGYYYRSGKKEKTEAILTAIIEKYPDSNEAKQAKQALQQIKGR